MNKKLFPLISIVLIVSLALAACTIKIPDLGIEINGTPVGSVELQVNSTNAVEPTAAPATDGESNQDSETSAPAEEKSSLPSEEPRTANGEFLIEGVPDAVDPTTVDIAKGDFKNTIGLGTEGWLAEPGKLLVGPEFPQDQIDSSGGAIERFNPLNQDGCRNNPPCVLMVPGGGFAFASLGWGKIEIDAVFGHVSITLPGKVGHNWHVYVRGLYGDGLPDTDENVNAVLTEYDAGHVDAHFYPGQPNGGFISEGQFSQKTQISSTEGTNCGDAGCSSLSALFLDLNTGAFTLITRETPSSSWQLVDRNW